MVGFKFNTHEKNDVFDFGIFGVKMIVLTGTLKKIKKKFENSLQRPGFSKISENSEIEDIIFLRGYRIRN